MSLKNTCEKISLIMLQDVNLTSSLKVHRLAKKQLLHKNFSRMVLKIAKLVLLEYFLVNVSEAGNFKKQLFRSKKSLLTEARAEI